MCHYRAFRIAAVAVLAAALGSAGLFALDAKKMDPPQGETLSRPPQHLRVFFDAAPDPAKSELSLEGPTGKLELQGLHTMGENDLMVRIVGRVADGEYTARFKAVGADGATAQGEWKFTVKRGG